MLPKWIYYFLGKKSGGDTPSGKFVVPDGMKFGYSYNFPENFIENCDFSNVVDFSQMFSLGSSTTIKYNWEEISTIDSSKGENFNSMFTNCTKLKKVENFDTSSATHFSSMFLGCTNLQNVPVFDFSRVTSYERISGMFLSCLNLSDSALDNILVSCISSHITSSTSKKLSTLGITDSSLTARVPNLPHYQNFINAGWSIS